MINLRPLPEHVQRALVAQRATLMYAEHKLSTDSSRHIAELEGLLLRQYAVAGRKERTAIITRLHELRRERNDIAAICADIRRVM